MPTSSTQTMVTSMVSSTGELITEILPFGYLLFGLMIAFLGAGFVIYSLKTLFKGISRM